MLDLDTEEKDVDQKAAPKALVVDDESYVRELLSRVVAGEGIDCRQAASGKEALAVLREGGFELLVTDINMPGMTGLELLAEAREQFSDLAVIMVTALGDRATAINALKLGAYGYIVKPFDTDEIAIAIANALERRRLMIESRTYEERLEGEVRERTADVRRSQSEIVMRLLAAAEYRDDDTGAHIRRIGLFAGTLAGLAGWDRDAVGLMQLAGSMHDIGKVGVPDAVLLKPGKLTPEEFDVIKQHTTIGARILGETHIPVVQLAKEIALTHHEKWDGSGYPNALAGDTIPQSGRITALCDVYDALVSHRVYRPALPEAEALDIMKKGRGSHFDPALFDLFIAALPEFRRIRGITDYAFAPVSDGESHE